MEEKPEPPWEVMLAEAELGSRPRAWRMAGSTVGDILVMRTDNNGRVLSDIQLVTTRGMETPLCSAVERGRERSESGSGRVGFGSLGGRGRTDMHDVTYRCSQQEQVLAGPDHMPTGPPSPVFPVFEVVHDSLAYNVTDVLDLINIAKANSPRSSHKSPQSCAHRDGVTIPILTSHASSSYQDRPISETYGGG